MTQRIILLGEVGAEIRPRLTFEGLTMLLQDIRASGGRMPTLILVSERERRDLNQDVLGASVEPVAKADQAPEHDGVCIGFVQGVPVLSSPNVPNGKCRLVYPPEKREVSDRLGGEGKIIVGA